MDIPSIKLTLMERLMLVWDEASLKRIGTAIETEIPEETGSQEYTDEEIAELDRQQAQHLNHSSVSPTGRSTLGSQSKAQRELSMTPYNFNVYWHLKTKDGKCEYDAWLKVRAEFQPTKGQILGTFTSVGEIPIVRVVRGNWSNLPEVHLKVHVVDTEVVLDRIVEEMKTAGWD
jgi:hypothetical protein